ncbi:hypothetical protein G4Y79_03780 [Phototrophicus methaneseepsis]|uniref:Uncharacterized protein n=1 Tax=Phototrophicus methaneseepsis TaxID=2710758 RepID=A0A7S8EAT4_9CHLR|nr:hypothetical protein [Phototrophicus methaneseepsis]QPC83514.1 hypothetical protein G4Y79_03780 [Phototrophicus methaneseepsis]
MPILQVVIFQGTGGVYNMAHEYYGESALVRAGHVGVIGVVENQILGFHPTPEEVESMGGEAALLEYLKGHDQSDDRRSVKGCLQDDTEYFYRAYELAEETNGRTTVYMYEVEIQAFTMQEILTWYTNRKIKLYSFPDGAGEFQYDVSNCATFWLAYFGIPLPVRTGRIKLLVEKMQIEDYSLWQPNA